jgi:hypothetical protein
MEISQEDNDEADGSPAHAIAACAGNTIHSI